MHMYIIHTGTPPSRPLLQSAARCKLPRRRLPAVTQNFNPDGQSRLLNSMRPPFALSTHNLRSFVTRAHWRTCRIGPLIARPQAARSLCTTFPRSTSSSSHDTPPFDDDFDMAAPELKTAKKGAIQLKTPKGTRDWIGADINLRDDIFQKIGDVFKRHGGTALDTPVFELNEILSNKYGEDQRLIYQLEDQGGELCSLRYDLTVPLARFLAQNTVQNLKRYQIAKVYRRDQPSMTRGRLREFYQCDFDIAGEYDAMIPDSEILCIIVEVFEALGLEEDITIKINHRKILDGLFTVAGVPEDKIRPISSAVDKLDKLPWEEVKKEMGEKGLSEEVADKIGEYVKLSGGAELIETLRKDAELLSNDDVKAGLNDLDLLFKYLSAFDVAKKVSFDLSLARGLDYYTGLIYEVVIKLPEIPSAPKGEDSRIGSIAAGGRYDNLVGMFSKRQIPCVGISFGVDRIFTILKLRQEKAKQQAVPKTDVFVMAFGGKGFDGLLPERMAIARLLWKAGIRAEFASKVKPKLPQQFKAAESNDVPLAVILGEGEVAAGQVRLKVLGLGDQATAEEKDGRLLAKEDLVAEVKKFLDEQRAK